MSVWSPRTSDQVFENCRTNGYHGVNITYPYKERVTRLVDGDPLSRQIGAVNTVVFGGRRPAGYNTDSSGFIAAYRSIFKDKNPGRVALIGAGGAGSAIAFALCELKALSLSLADTDRSKAQILAARIKSVYPHMDIRVQGATAAVQGADGIVNATPIGMTEYPGCAIPPDAMGSQRWAFDAVYTPPDTAFLTHARRAGLRVMTGFELFLHQGIQAFEILTGHKADPIALRHRLQDPSLANIQD